MQNNNPSKLEQMITQIAEWKARFLHEREWRESVEKDKKELQEKYEQVVYELGTQRKQVEQLERQVKLLAAGSSPERPDESLKAEEGDEMPTEEEEALDIMEENGEDNNTENSEEDPLWRPHHVYTSTAIHEALAAHRPFIRDVSDAHTGEPLPVILHRYDPELHISEPPIDTRRDEDDLDEILDDINDER